MRLSILLFFVAGLLLLLCWQFPYAVGTTEQQMRILYLVLLLMVVGGGSGMVKRMRRPQMARDMLIWLGIVLLLVFGYSFRDQIKHSRIAGELMPARIQSSSDGSLNVTMAEDGHFHMEAEVNGTLLNFMIDTGASDIVLSKRDAVAAGFNVSTLNYSRAYSTANGAVGGAPIKINTMNIGAITFHNLSASVDGGDTETSLLGMTFLKQFSSYRVDGNRLTLTP